MYFFTLDKCVLLFVEQADGCQCSILFYNKDLRHIRRITQADALLCKTAVHFVLHMVNGKDTVRRNTAFNFKQKPESVKLAD